MTSGPRLLLTFVLALLACDPPTPTPDPDDAGARPAEDAAATGDAGGPEERPDSGPYVPADCGEPHPARAATAPDLPPGEWVNISPRGGGIAFGPDGGSNLTQGMALDPCDPNVIYLAVCATRADADFPKGVYRTRDGGASWERILESDSPNHIRVNPEDPRQIYVTDGVAGGTRGFHRTYDGGQTWEHLTNMCEDAGLSNGCLLFDLYDVAVDPTDFDHVLIAFHSPRVLNGPDDAGVMESHDGGDTWVEHYPGTRIPDERWGHGQSVHFLYNPALGIGNSDTWLVTLQMSGGRWRTSDGGETWRQVTEHSGVHGGASMVWGADGAIYLGSEGGVIRSRDNGLTFEHLGGNVETIGVGTDGERIYAGHLTGGPLVSTPVDDPSSWTPTSETFEGGPFEFAYDAENGILYAASIWEGLVARRM